MMNDKSSALLPVGLIVFGTLWFLKSADLLPDTADIIAAALIGAGVLVGVLDGFNKQSLISVPMLWYAGAAVYARQHYNIAMPVLAALAMILAGCLMLLARSPLVPEKPSEPKDKA